ncbi:DMT family protein [Chitinophaga sp. 212800010-3]|uniref:DMT family protein n=1 Tax=unclassified Chitinophaga TaxID=2619133 RepID=UPI002DE52504|nr:DMT family protein [Chitinophaga sp. 212800010-3]
MRTIILLTVSNTFMTFAWYGHLKHQDVALWKVILISWGIAFFEYCFMVPANRFGMQDGFNGFQLKTIQEVITLTVFSIFAVTFLKEPLRWNYFVSFLFLIGAVWFMFRK